MFVMKQKKLFSLAAVMMLTIFFTFILVYLRFPVFVVGFCFTSTLPKNFPASYCHYTKASNSGISEI